MIEGRESNTMISTHPAAKKMRTALIGGVLAGAVVLGGCAQSPTTVAKVNGTVISKSDLNSAYGGAQQVTKQVTKDQVASALIQGTVANQIAEQRDIKLSQDRREKVLDPQLLNKSHARDFAFHLADVQIVGKKIGEKKLAKQVSDADVSLNPRYGHWKPKKSVNVLPSSGSLSKNSKPSHQPSQPQQPPQ